MDHVPDAVCQRKPHLGGQRVNQALLIADISIENPAEYTDLFWELI